MREFSFKPRADLRLHCTCTSSLKVLCDVSLRSNCYLVEAQYSKNISTGFASGADRAKTFEVEHVPEPVPGLSLRFGSVFF